MTRAKLAPLVADLLVLAAVTLVHVQGASWRTLTAAGGAVMAHAVGAMEPAEGGR